MAAINVIDRAAFAIAVVSGAVGAVAGGAGWTKTAIVAGCLAAVAPIASRVASNRAMAAIQQRTLTAQQQTKIADELKTGPAFKVWVCHNRQEAEPAAFHELMCEALKQGGLDVQWFGGMTNSTAGVEVAGPDGPEKERLMKALAAARVRFLKVVLTDDTANHWGVSVWIGVRS